VVGGGLVVGGGWCDGWCLLQWNVERVDVTVSGKTKSRIQILIQRRSHRVDDKL